MASIGRLTIDIAANVAKLQQDMNKVQRTLGKFSDEAEKGNRTLSRIARSTSFIRLTASIVAAQLATRALRAAWNGVFGGIRKGLKAADDYKTDVASIAALVTTLMDKTKPLPERWKEAKRYAEGIIPVVEEVAAQTLVSGRHATLLVQQFAMGGVLIDANNKKQIEGLKAVANAIAVLTKGQDTERQILTEVRSLMSGEIRATSILAKTLEGINPKLKEQLKLWREQGTVLENLGNLLSGFQPATEDLRLTWAAVKTTLDTTLNQILRGGFLPVYEDLMKSLLQINTYLNVHKKELQTGILEGYRAIKRIIKDDILPLIDDWITGMGLIFKKFNLARDYDEAKKKLKELGMWTKENFPMHFKFIRGPLTDEEMRRVVDFTNAITGTVSEAERLKRTLDETIAPTAPPKIMPMGIEEGEKKLKKMTAEMAAFTKNTVLAQQTLQEMVDTGQITWGEYLEGLERFNKVMEENKEKIIQSDAALEAFNDGVILNQQTLQQLADQGSITWGQYVEGIQNLRKVQGLLSTETTTFLMAIQEEYKILAENIGRYIVQWSDTFAYMLNSMLWGAKTTFGEILKSFAELITQMILKAAALKTIGFFGSLFGGLFEKGGIFAEGRPLPFAKGGIVKPPVMAFAGGGVVTQPTIFPMASGLGLMGERGPEAVMPLTRTPSGDLGVKTEGKPMVINNNINITVESMNLDKLDRYNLNRFAQKLIPAISKAHQEGTRLRI